MFVLKLSVIQKILLALTLLFSSLHPATINFCKYFLQIFLIHKSFKILKFSTLYHCTSYLPAKIKLGISLIHRHSSFLNHNWFSQSDIRL